MIKPGKPHRHAIIIGSSIAGVLTARVLSDYFAQVTLLERDTLPDGYAHRKWVPQAHHAHALLARGTQLIEQFFPGIHCTWGAAGASRYDDIGDILHLVMPGGRAPRATTGISYHTLSRVLLEGSIRERVMHLPGVTIHQGMEVTGLHTSDNRRMIDGVWARPSGSNAEPQGMAADLVVDTSGRTSKLATWLEALGYGQPAQTTVTVQGGYASRWYKMPAEMQGGIPIPWVLMQPPHMPRSGIILPTEHNTMVTTMAGCNGVYPPVDEDEFAAFAASLYSPLIAERIKQAQPISEIIVYRRLDNVLRHYDQMRDFPERLLVLGDAYVALNPVYGQGMTAAAMSAEALQQILQRHPSLDGLERTLHRRVIQVLNPFWQMATSEDLRWSTIQGAKPSSTTRFLHWYMDSLMALIPTHPSLFVAFCQVQHGLAAPTILFKPSILLPILAHKLQILRTRRHPVTTG